MAISVLPLALLVWQRQNIEDWYKLRSYQAPPAIVQIAEQDTLTSEAKRLFYINKPQLVSDRVSFAKDCSVTEKTIILGCYHSGENGIFIFDVSKKILAGVEQVTAAHETLHAAYERLNQSEKNYINGLLKDYYKNDLRDKRIIEVIAGYQKTEPDDVVNEMHSIFGTEVAKLPSPLENYYKRYFANRSKVVAYSKNYESQFTIRTDRINRYDQELAAMKQNIDSQEESLVSQSAQIEQDRRRLDSYKESGNISAYNAGVGSFNAEVRNYNSAVDSLRNAIAQYNQLVKDRNALAEDLRGLTAQIDTRISTQPSE